MDSPWGTPNHRKRKRRRVAERPPLPAQLSLDSRLEGDTAVLSEDLLLDLFPESDQASNPGPHTRYIAITAQEPSGTPLDTAQWVVLPVSSLSPNDLPRSSLRFSASSTIVEPLLARISQRTPAKRGSVHGPVDIHILNISPLPLITIIVGVEEIALRFQDLRWEEMVRSALNGTKLVHTRDRLSLQLRTATNLQPVTAIVEFCEPVSQGLLVPGTKIIVVPSTKKSRVPKKNFSLPMKGVSEEDEDTSNEQFYSATENRLDSPGPDRSSTPQYQTVETWSVANSDEDDIDLSDNDLEAVGLSLPKLPLQSALFSSISSATSRRVSSQTIGTASPGSVVSGLSSATITDGISKARAFQTRSLLQRIRDEDILPRPSADEDEEARVFVDTASLAKIGCFSAAWVRLEAISSDTLNHIASCGASPYDANVGKDPEWRVAKVYGLPGGSSSRPRHSIDRGGRRDSINSSAHFSSNALNVYMSPLLLANLGAPPSIRLMALTPPTRGPTKPHQRRSVTSMPPFAKEVALYKLSTPLSTERTMDTSLFQGLRKYFENKRRVVKTGDLIGIPIDDDLGRAIYQGLGGKEDMEQDELLSRCGKTQSNSAKIKVGWFKVGPVAVDTSNEEHEHEEDEPWGASVVVRPGVTRMVQTGSEPGRLPAAISNEWPYYLGTKRLPAKSSKDESHVIESIVPYISQTRRRLRELISAATSPQALHFQFPPLAVLLVSTQRHIGKSTAATSACADLGIHTFTIDAYDILSEGGSGGGDVKTAGLLEARAERAMTCGAENTALLVKHIDILTADRMTSTLNYILSTSRVLLATTTEIEKVPEGIRSLFTHELELTAPDEKEREGLLVDIVRNSGMPLSSDVDLSSVALKTAALVAGDLVDVVERASVARQERLERLAAESNAHLDLDQPAITGRDVLLSGGDASRCLIKVDFDVAVEAARKNFADAIGAPKIPNVSWNDVGGLTNVKDAVMETIQLPLERPELFAKGMKKRSGILFYGPPGTGKTLLAKAIATEFSLNFFSVKGPELLNMYIGESEANVRRVFQRARDARPCVVFFDELDSVAPKRGNQGDSGGVMDRIVSQLLAELDGMSGGDDGGGGVFVIGATNRPDLLDQALLRPGRFDKMLYLGVSDTHDKQLTILEALTRKFALDPALSLTTIASILPFTYTGADLYALCSDAMLKAITRRATSVDTKVRHINTTRAFSSPPLPQISVSHFFDHLASSEDTEVVVEQEDFEAAVRELVPSVSVGELEHYARVRAAFEKGGEEKEVEHGGRKEQIKGLLKRRNGGGNGGNNGSSRQIAPSQAVADDFVLRTEGLSMHDAPSGANGLGHGSMNGEVKQEMGVGMNKGKEKATVPLLADGIGVSGGFGDAAEGDDLY